MQYRLMKSEPGEFGILDLARDKVTPWIGVRNYQARNFLRDQVRKGDLAFLYHSNCNAIGIARIVIIVRAGYPDYISFDSDSSHYGAANSRDSACWYVDVRFKRRLKRITSLDELRSHSELRDMVLLPKGNRLSVMPVTKQQWDFILTLE